MKKETGSDGSLSRRKFMRKTAMSVGGVGAIISSSRPASARIQGANDRIRIGAIGLGGRSRKGLTPHHKNQPDTEIVALCDVYEPNLLRAVSEIEVPNAKKFKDYRALLDDQSIDAVVIGTPDHWHAKMVLDALQAGKDIYVEKPVTHSLDEGEALIKAVETSKRIVQTGTQQRSWPHFIEGKKIVDAGTLGRITSVRMWWYQNYPAGGHSSKLALDKLDQKAWLGKAPAQTITPAKFYWWRWYWDFGGGALTDLMSHWIDVVHWYLDDPTPATATTVGNRYILDWDCPDTITCVLEYPKQFTTTYHGGMTSSIDDGGMELRGTKATMKLNRDRLAVYTEEGQLIGNTDSVKPGIYIESKQDGTIDHVRNFLDSVKSRRQPTANIRAGVEAARAAHIGNLALKEGRTVRWKS